MPETRRKRRSRRSRGESSPETRQPAAPAYLTRRIPVYEVLGEEGLAKIETNAETILEEIGIDFKDDPEALDIWRQAGADVRGERVRIPRGFCRRRPLPSLPPWSRPQWVDWGASSAAACRPGRASSASALSCCGWQYSSIVTIRRSAALNQMH